jgi:hypothetical protein
MTTYVNLNHRGARSWLFASFKPRYFSRRHKFLKEHDRGGKSPNWISRFEKDFLRGLQDENRPLKFIGKTLVSMDHGDPAMFS